VLAEVIDIRKDQDNELVPAGSYGQGNVLLNAAYTMPLYCKRLILLGLSKIRYSEGDDSDDAFTFEVTASDWKAVFGGTNAYAQMKRACIALNDDKPGALWYKTEHGDRGRRWFDEVEYEDKRGLVRMEFARKIRANLRDLAENGDYTPVDLKAVCALESTYSIRLYEMCRQFRDTGIAIKPVDEFRRAFRLESKYKAFTDLRMRVIEPAIAEINDKTPIGGGLKWKVKKDGAKITTLVFTFPKHL
jgi:plasmid replication initiation protein